MGDSTATPLRSAARSRVSRLQIRSVAPGRGPVGTAVKITGSDFAAGDIVEFGGVRAQQARVNKAGTTIAAAVPAFAPSGLVTVIDPAGLQASSPHKFAITRGLAAVPARQRPGADSTIEGSALKPDSRITVTLDGKPILILHTNHRGDFAARWRVPDRQAPGKYLIFVRGYRVPKRVAAGARMIPAVPIQYLSPIIFTVLSPSSPWPQYGQDSAHTGADPYELFLPKSHIAGGLKVHVLLPLGGTIVGATSVSGGLAFTVTNSGHTAVLYAVNLVTRKVKWSSVSFGPSTSAPAVSGNRVYVASEDKHVYSFPTSCSTPCSPDWISQAAGGAFLASSPDVYNGDVLVGAQDGSVYDYPANCSYHCSPNWVSQATGGPIDGSPAADNGSVYAGSYDGRLYAYPVSCSTRCKPSWVSQPTGGPILGSTAAGNSTVFVASSGGNEGKLYAFPEQCTSPCSPTWVSTPMSPYTSDATPAIANSNVYVGEGESVYGYPESCSYPCSPSWQTQAQPYVLEGAPAIANGVLFINSPVVTGGGGLLYAFDTTCGPACAPIWTSPGWSLDSEPSISGDVFVGRNNGNLYGFG